MPNAVQQNVLRRTLHAISKWCLIIGATGGIAASGEIVCAATTLATNVIYVAPRATGTQCTRRAPCSLEAARAKVRQMNRTINGDVTVQLRGGVYELDKPFELGAQDSGTNGFRVIYEGEATGRTVISGGARVRNWVLFDAKRNIYRAKANGANTRQLYVNNVLATRARTEDKLDGFTKTANGFQSAKLDLSKWKNLNDIELVGYNEWRAHRCGIASIENGHITLKQPCWKNSQRDRWSFTEVKWIENAFELLDREGEWYIDRATETIYYKPRADENMRTAIVIAPAVEALIDTRGTLDAPIKNITFKNLNFAFSNWIEPNGNDGYTPLQAGHRRTGENDKLKATPAAVRFSSAENIRFEGNGFYNLGGAGIAFDNGSRDIEIIGNKFYDIASHAVHVGNVFEPEPKDARLYNSRFVISNNFIRDIGAVYEDACAILAGYVSDTVISHNDIGEIPYTGISIGWGWGKKSYMRANRVINNRVVNYMLKLKDGGGIYTLSDQPDSVVEGNFISTPATAENGGHAGLYFDEGTGFYTARNNAFDLPDNIKRGWLNLAHNNSCHDIRVENSFTTTAVMATTGRTPETRGKTPPNFELKNTNVVMRGDLPRIAATIINRAGLEDAYKNLKR